MIAFAYFLCINTPVFMPSRLDIFWEREQSFSFSQFVDIAKYINEQKFK